MKTKKENLDNKKPLADVGVIHGRFQVLHNDHLKYLMTGKARCRHLVVGITNPDPKLTGEDSADPVRSNPAANPLSYFERYIMIREALLEANVSLQDFSIVPFPINFPELFEHYVPLDATFFLTILDDWGRRKLQVFQSLGLKTEVLWEKPLKQKGLVGAEVRRLMAAGGPWQDLVPESTTILVERWQIPERLRKMLR